MKRSFLKILLIASSAIFFIVPETAFGAGEIVINEFLADPQDTDTGLEWIKLYNPDDQPIEIGGWQLNAVSGKYFIFPAFSLGAKSFITIHWRTDGTNSSNEFFTGTQGISENMGNKSGFIALFKNEQHNKDTIVDYLEYGEAGKTWESTASSTGIWTAGQFINAAGEGQSLGLKQAGQDNNQVSDWETFNQSTTNQQDASSPPPTTLTPQDQNQNQQTPLENQQTQTIASSSSAFLNYSNQILINEFLPWPALISDSTSSAKEWVEIKNGDDQIIDLSGWQIDDGPEGSSPQVIQEGSLIEPGQLLVISLTKNILNNDGDQIRLLWPNDELVHSVSFQKAISGFSSARFGNGIWLWTNQPTPGQENKKSIAKIQTDLLEDNPANLPRISPLTEATTESALQIEIKKEGSSESKIPEIAAGQSNALIKNLSNKQMPKTTEQKQGNASSYKIFAIIGVVVIFSFLSGLALAYFRKKSLIDSG